MNTKGQKRLRKSWLKRRRLRRESFTQECISTHAVIGGETVVVQLNIKVKRDDEELPLWVRLETVRHLEVASA